MWMLIHLVLSQSSFTLSLFIFIHFSLFYSTAMISTTLSAHLFFLLPQLLCYWFLLVYSSFQLLYCSSLCVCFLNFLALFKTIHISSRFVPSFLFWILFTIIILILFQVDCLSHLHLVALVGWFLVPLSETYFCNLILSNFLCLWSLLHKLKECSPPCFWCLSPGRWGWPRNLCRLPGERDRCLPSGGWSWVLFFLCAGLSQGICLEVAVSSVCHQVACLLMGVSVFLFC